MYTYTGYTGSDPLFVFFLRQFAAYTRSDVGFHVAIARSPCGVSPTRSWPLTRGLAHRAQYPGGAA